LLDFHWEKILCDGAMYPSELDFPHKDEIVAALRVADPSIKKIFLFGSRARGDNLSPVADIDIGILAEKKLSLWQLEKINAELEAFPTLYRIDLVDFTGRDDEFTREALADMKVLYEKR